MEHNGVGINPFDITLDAVGGIFNEVRECDPTFAYNE